MPNDFRLSPAVVQRQDALREAFANAQPYRHVVIDDFLDPGFAARLLEQFPRFEQGNSVGEDGRPGGKSTFEQVRALGEAYATLDDLVSSRGFLRTLGKITGIDGLMYDPWYLGGGTHENRTGAILDPHIDFNYHPLERWRRRLNLIIYLNEDWHAEWGGALNLYRDPRLSQVPDHAIAPAFNRCVIFETNDHSWHGFDRISVPEQGRGRTRRSIALYFYTPPEPDPAAAEAHSTVYVSRGLPGHLHAGHALSERDMVELRNLVAEKDNRIAIQYREIAKLMTLVQAHERGFAGSMMYMARKVFARLQRRPA